MTAKSLRRSKTEAVRVASTQSATISAMTIVEKRRMERVCSGPGSLPRQSGGRGEPHPKLDSGAYSHDRFVDFIRRTGNCEFQRRWLDSTPGDKVGEWQIDAAVFGAAGANHACSREFQRTVIESDGVWIGSESRAAAPRSPTSAEPDVLGQDVTDHQELSRRAASKSVPATTTGFPLEVFATT